MRGATAADDLTVAVNIISIHAPRAGRDCSDVARCSCQRDFNPRAPCGARQSVSSVAKPPPRISIHAPRAGRDIYLVPQVGVLFVISIHAPRAGRDDANQTKWRDNVADFNPRAPCGARRWPSPAPTLTENFNPRAPCGARPGGQTGLWQQRAISIHAPRAGRDGGRRGSWCSPDDFNPRAPCGARHKSVVIVNSAMIFQSTRPVRGATLLFLRLKLRRIHFNPRAPCGARPQLHRALADDVDISIHAPRAGRDSTDVTLTSVRGAFQSTRPVRGATEDFQTLPSSSPFQSTRPVRGATGMQRGGLAEHLFQSTRPVRGATPSS